MTKPALLLTWALLCSTVGLAQDETVQFARDIRPILADHCWSCHGPDNEQRQADLRLDRAEEALADRNGTTAFVPGDLEASEVWLRITSTDADERMPPAGVAESLTLEQIDLIGNWIKQGAQWERHWAFVPPRKPAVPQVASQGWPNNPIDHFVLARLEHKNLSPAPQADKATLLRRLSLDLTGLPPTVHEVDDFLNDRENGAYKRQVTRLLKSSHYGEHWARYWLDASRYADSDGFEKDKPRQVWAFRDWVIRALNKDLPYDQFIIAQIAGDLLPNASQDQLVATGFLRNSMLNEEGGVDPEQFRMEAMFDRMDAIGKSILGITIQCGQCHHHKYDPLTQNDYYRIFAFINNAHEANASVHAPMDLEWIARIQQRVQQIEDQLKEDDPDWAQHMALWEDTQLRPPVEWEVLIPHPEDRMTGGQKYLLQPDGSMLAQGYAPTKFIATFRVRSQKTSITAFRLELMRHPNLPHGGPGRSPQGTAALTEFAVEVAPAADPSAKTKVPISRAIADISLPEQPLLEIYADRTDRQRVTGPIEYAIDDDKLTAWGIDAGPGKRNEPRQAVFVVEDPASISEDSELTIQLSQRHGGWNSDDNQNHNLGRFRLSLTNQHWAGEQALPPAVETILKIPRDQRTLQQVDVLFSYWRTTIPEWQTANEQIEAAWQAHPEPASQLVLRERDSQRMTHRLKRGDFLQPAEVVQPGVPDFLHPLPENAPLNRLTFAHWLVDRESPTTARAIVNRVWQSYFGTGLVSTSEDFGLRSEPPSHPQMLDWLAVEFMESGWSLKRLHTLIATSATYQQSSSFAVAADGLLEKDPRNRLLARGARLRVDAEVVRDIALYSSGLLNPRVGGPSVFPPSPAFLYQQPASYGPKSWNESPGRAAYRRALYTFRFRSVPYPPLQTFDAPNGDFSCVRRERSNTPLQALVTLNEPVFLACARELAWNVLLEGGSTEDEQLTYAYRRCLSRPPNDGERKILKKLLSKHLREFSDSQSKPWLLAAADPENPPKLPKGTSAADLAAWTALSRVLLNLDETITKQ